MNWRKRVWSATGVIAILTSTNFQPVFAQLQPAEIVVLTEILSFDPAAGVKSKHTIDVDFVSRRVSDRFETGNTFGIGAVRSTFSVSEISFDEETVSFRVKGETASGVLLLPNINYDFRIVVKPDGSAKLLGGCHDGYPAYFIDVNTRRLYEFRHESIRVDRLFGDCDVSPSVKEISAR